MVIWQQNRDSDPFKTAVSWFLPMFFLLICSAHRSDFLLYRKSCMLTGKMSDIQSQPPFFTVLFRVCVFNVFTCFITTFLLVFLDFYKYSIFLSFFAIFLSESLILIIPVNILITCKRWFFQFYYVTLALDYK